MVKLNIAAPDIEDVKKDFVGFIKANPRAIALAMNAAGAKARTASLRNVYTPSMNSEAWNVRAKDIKALAGRDKKATQAKHRYVFEFNSKGGVPLLDFTRTHDKRAQTKKGVRYRVKKKTGSKVQAHAFINKSKKRKSSFVLIRENDARYPLIPLTVVTPSYMFLQSKSDKVFTSTFTSLFNKSYLQKLNYLMSRKS